MKNNPPEFSDLVLAALEVVNALQENEIDRIGQDEGTTMRAVAAVSQLHYMILRTPTKRLSRHSKMLLADVKQHCISFQNSSANRRALYKMGELSRKYREALAAGRQLCEEIAPQSAEVYRMAFGT